jgi:pentatricopeptide repeat protein
MMNIFNLKFHKQIHVLFFTSVTAAGAFRFLSNSNMHYASLLQGCSNIKTLKQVHAHILIIGLQQDVFLGTKLVTMYNLYDSLENARLIFDKIHNPNVFLWNAMIRGYARIGLFKESIKLYYHMHLTGISPDKFTFLFVLKACAHLSDLQEGKEIHHSILASGLDSDVFVATALVDMYAKCGDVETARQLFDKMPERDVVSWNAIMARYAENGDANEVLILFRNMQQAYVKPNSGTMISLLSGLAALQRGKLIHGYVIRNGFDSEISVMNALIDMYAKSASIDIACQVFDRMCKRDVVSWSSMISGCAQNGQAHKALTLFNQMKQTDTKPNCVTVLSVLPACADLGDLQQGKNIHSFVQRNGLESDDSVGSALVAMYAKCTNIEVARQVFDSLPKRNAVTWNAMIAGYVHNGYADEPLVIFNQMQLADVRPDRVTVISVIPACAHVKALQQGKYLHSYAIKRGFLSHTSLSNSIIDMYAKCGKVDCARKLFDNMYKRDLVSWNTMIAGYAQNEHSNKALALFHELQHAAMTPNNITIVNILSVCGNGEALQQGKDIHDYIMRTGFPLDISVMTALVVMHAKCGSIEIACQLFDKMSKRDVVSWNAMIAGYVQNGYANEALTLFYQLQISEEKPDSATLITVLPACAELGALQHGKWIHAYIIKNGFELYVSVGTALIDMYAKCGSIESAFQLFDKMCNKDVVSWNAMIAAYGMNGHGEGAVTLFSQMQQAGLMPDHVTFISVLSACSHSGLVDEGRQYFDCMSQDYYITPRMEHYVCMVDLLGRAGFLNEAHNFIKNMPLEPGIGVWGALLFACRIHCNIELGEHVAKLLIELDPRNSGTYILLSSIYATAKRWDDVAKVRSKLKESGLEKSPGRSWIVLKNRVHVFLVGDKSHPQSEKIYAMLKNLTWKMKKAGYEPDARFVLHDME